MTRSARFLLLSLLLLCPLPLARSQAVGNPAGNSCTGPIQLQVGLDDGQGGTVWTCDPNAQGAVVSGFMRVQAQEGSWAQILPQIFIENPNPNDPVAAAAEQTLLTQFPWLAKLPDWYLWQVLGPGWSNTPPVRIAWDTFWNNVFLPLQNLDPNDIKKFYQPVLAGANQQRLWFSDPPVWQANPLSSNPHVDMSILWKALTEDFMNNPDIYDFFSIMQFAAILQGGADGEVFLGQGNWLELALQNGLLHMSLQAIILRSNDPNLIITSDELTTDGLTGLDQLTLPDLQVSVPLEINITQGIPLSNGPTGTTVFPGIPTHNLQVGHWNLIPVRRLVPPTSLTIHAPNLPALGPFPVLFLAPGRGKVFIPAGLAVGLSFMDITNPFGTNSGSLNAAWSLVNLTVEPLNPLSVP